MSTAPFTGPGSELQQPLRKQCQTTLPGVTGQARTALTTVPVAPIVRSRRSEDFKDELGGMFCLISKLDNYAKACRIVNYYQFDFPTRPILGVRGPPAAQAAAAAWA